MFRLLHTLGGPDVDVINTLLDEETEAEAVSRVTSCHTLLDSTCKPSFSTRSSTLMKTDLTVKKIMLCKS